MKPKVKLQITTLFLLLLLPENAILWRRRRRRRAPAPVNCQVGSWTSWGSCSYPCGNSGTQTRTRAITVAAAHGGSCSYHLSESQACNRGNCQNGGTPHSTGCSCRAGYTGTCCSQDIDECLTSPCDHTCTNTFGSYTCQCNSCYTKLGTRCELRQCRISGSCYSYDTVNPNNQCQDCQSTNKMAWTNNDTLSCSDGVACTRNDTCSSGTCAGTPYTCLSCEECNNDTCRVKEGFCATVEGGTKTCFSHGDLRPGYPCQDCQSTNKMAWTNNDTLSCNDGVACTRNDTCSNGSCAGTPYTCLSCEECNNDTCLVKEGFCAIMEGGTNTCFSHGDLRPGYPCQDCQSTNKMAWTNNDTLSCSDGVACTRNDSCSSGSCAGTAYTCLSCEECNNNTCRVKEGFCAIVEGGTKTCFSHGDLRPGYPCQDCQSTNKMAWTNNDTLSCSDGVACTRNDSCSSGSCAGTPYSCLSCEECNNDTCRVKAGFCAIVEGGSKTCFSHGDLRPGYPCQDCQSTNKMAWTNNDTLSCSDGVACTRNDTCSSGTCAGTPYTCLSCEECNNDTCRVKEGFCAIVEGGTKTCFSHGDLRPGYPCQDCQSTNKMAWTNNDFLSCSDGVACTRNDSCSSGTCVGTPYTCLSCEECNNDTCRVKWCDPSISTSTWSNREGVACNDGDQCTRGDTCQSGRCSTTPFTCNSLCQYCNGSGCSLKTGFGFTNGCTCKIGGQDYNNQTVNPSNQCEWCDLYDATARANGAWSNRSAVPCDDQNRCTKQDTCNSGRCEGQAYSCQSSFPSTSCIKTSECVGDGTCREIIRASGTICRPAIDICDQPERCDGNRETCPGAEHDSISITTGSAQFTDQSFLSVISYHNLTNKLYVRLTGFSASCGQLNFQWFLLSSSSACITASTVKGAFPNSNTRQTLTGLPLQDNSNYKVSIQAVDMRNNTAQHVCSGVININ